MYPDGKYIVQILGGQVDQSTIHPYTQSATDILSGYWSLVIIGVVLLAALVAWFGYGYQHWRVWAATMRGEADLANANREQQIQVAQAQGRINAATLNKQAAVIEAEAVALQINEIGTTLTEHDLYLKWQWIEMMRAKPNNSVIYVPTEAGMPILEAGKRNQITNE